MADKVMTGKKGKRARDEEDEELEEEHTLSESKGRATPGRRAQETQTGGGNFITRPLMGFIEYLGDVRAELDKVTWPSREDVFRLGYIVLAVTIASSLLLGALSIFLTEVFRIGLQVPAIFGAIIIIALGLALWALWRGSRTPTAY